LVPVGAFVLTAGGVLVTAGLTLELVEASVEAGGAL
jgi:hypothetical protein